MESKSDELIALLPPRKVLFRQRGQSEWDKHHFTILGQAEVLGLSRSAKPTRLVLSTSFPGYLSMDILGLDLFAAIASAMLSVDNMILRLCRVGEIQLRYGVNFDVSSDSVFFGDRIQRLHGDLGI
jgi:hypothetical protein